MELKDENTLAKMMDKLDDLKDKLNEFEYLEFGRLLMKMSKFTDKREADMEIYYGEIIGELGAKIGSLKHQRGLLKGQLIKYEELCDALRPMMEKEYCVHQHKFKRRNPKRTLGDSYDYVNSVWGLMRRCPQDIFTMKKRKVALARRNLVKAMAAAGINEVNIQISDVEALEHLPMED